MNQPYSRTDFNRRRLTAQNTVRRASRVAAVVSVVLGVTALLFLNRMDTFLTGSARISTALLTFSLFISIATTLVLNIKRTARKTAITCPQCTADLLGDALRIASATGRCEQCGGTVITPENGG